MSRITSTLGLVGVAAVTVVVACVSPVLASTPPTVPEPASVTLLSVGIAAVAIGARWRRRK